LDRASLSAGAIDKDKKKYLFFGVDDPYQVLMTPIKTAHSYYLSLMLKTPGMVISNCPTHLVQGAGFEV